MQYPYNDIYLLYAFVGFVCAIIIGIVRNRIHSTSYKSTIDRKLLNVLTFYLCFCVLDASWGILGMRIIAEKVPLLFEIISYVFHTLAATSSVIIAFYASSYFKVEGLIKKIFRIFSIVLFVGQLAFLYQNIWTHNFFIVDEVGNYSSYEWRIGSFILQFIQYIPLFVYSVVMWIKSARKHESAYIYISGFIFLIIPLAFGVLQMLYPDSPFYSLGFMAFSITIFVFNVTAQRENFLSEYHRVEEQRKSYKAIQAALQAANDANNAKSQFLANMSHDIRTPINGIMGITTLAKQEETSDKMRDYLNKIDAASHHLLSLVNDVLDMSRIESKQNALLNIETADIHSLIDECSIIVNGELVNKEVEFIQTYEDSLKHPIVMCDPLRLKQIFINILGNSVKFTSTGNITLNIKELTYADDFVTLQFTFTDTGIGMTQEFIDKNLFEPFSQAANSGRTQYQGTGLGMSIVKQLVELMKGTIEVSSVLNQGTKFVVTIPFKVGESSSLENKEVVSDEEFDLTGIKCLLVEDNDLNLEIAKTMFEELGLIVEDARNGQEAVDKFSSSEINHFDIVFMDIMMPIMNGYDATTEIRKLDREDAKTTPIIAMTANAFDEDKKKAVSAGMNGHVSKPVDFSKIASVIRQHLVTKGK